MGQKILTVCVYVCVCLRVCIGRDDDFERTKKTDFKGEYQGMKEEPVVSHILLSVVLVVVV